MKTMLRLALAVAVAAFAAPALAQGVQTASFQVTANVLRTCQLRNQTTLAFGDYDPLVVTDLPGTSTFEFRCNRTTPYTITIDNGAHYDAVGLTRRMVGPVGTDLLAYGLYQDAAHGTAWGSTVGTSVTGTGVAGGGWNPLTIYGLIPAAQYVASGGYLDTPVVITISY